MSTITNNPGKKLKATINQQNPQSEAVNAIQKYLAAVHENEDVEANHSTMWAISHMLCPWKRNSDAEDMEYLIEKIIAFMFHPKRLTTFFQSTGFKPEDVYESLIRMKEFFNKMSKAGPEAELTLFNIVNRGNYYNAEGLKTEANYFTKMLAVEEAHNEAFRI